ncbi:MAG TPA: hypothetical protein VF212_15965 [Longimicrobiales bacterium]
MERPGRRERRSVDWSAAVWSGLIAGIVFITMTLTLVPAFRLGSPWEVVRMIAAIVLGPDVLYPPTIFDAGIFAVAMALHFSLSTLYSIVRVWIVEGWLTRLPAFVQGAFGLVIYLINFYGFTRIFPWFIEARSWVVIFVHLSWGVVLPLAYDGLTGRRAGSRPT